MLYRLVSTDVIILGSWTLLTIICTHSGWKCEFNHGAAALILYWTELSSSSVIVVTTSVKVLNDLTLITSLRGAVVDHCQFFKRSSIPLKLSSGQLFYMHYSNVYTGSTDSTDFLF